MIDPMRSPIQERYSFASIEVAAATNIRFSRLANLSNLHSAAGSGGLDSGSAWSRSAIKSSSFLSPTDRCRDRRVRRLDRTARAGARFVQNMRLITVENCQGHYVCQSRDALHIAQHDFRMTRAKRYRKSLLQAQKILASDPLIAKARYEADFARSDPNAFMCTGECLL